MIQNIRTKTKQLDSLAKCAHYASEQKEEKMAYHLSLRPDGDLFFSDRVWDRDNNGSKGVPDNIQQRLSFLSVENLEQGATSSLPDVDWMLFHRTGTNVLSIPGEAALAPVAPIKVMEKLIIKNNNLVGTRKKIFATGWKGKHWWHAFAPT